MNHNLAFLILQRKFHIPEDSQGERKKHFFEALCRRFRKRKSWLVARFITRKLAPKEGSPNADKKPWELYAGFVTSSQWETFEAYVNSDQFQVKIFVLE